MAGITDLQYKLMEMQSAGTPEFDAGLYPYKELQFEDYFSPPKGPLYNIDPTLVPEGENYYSEDYDFDTDKTSYSQWPQVDNPIQRLNVELMPDTHALGTSRGAEQFINPELMKAYGTFPTSPRNEMSPVPDWYRGATTELPRTETVEGNLTTSSRNEAVNQANINKYIRDVLSHEVSHSLDTQRGFKSILEEAEGIEIGYGPTKLSEHEMEELYTRAREIERVNIMNPNRKGASDMDLIFGEYEDQGDIAKKYILDKLGSVEAMNNYLKRINPLVNRYFNQVAKHKRYKKSKESGRKPGHWYHGLDYKGGAAGDVSQAGPGRQDPEGGKSVPPSAPISVPVPAHIRGGGARHAPHPDRGGGRRPDKPGGFTDPGKGSYGPHMAYGGLMDIPLPGRRRDI